MCSSASPLWCFAEEPRARESEWGPVYVGDLEEGSWGSAIRLTLTPNLRREDTKSKGGTGIHKKTPDRAYLDAHAPRFSGSPQSTLVLCRVLRIGNQTAPCHEPRSEARRRRRRRDTTKPTTHANDSPRRTSAASNGALIRLRQVENQSAPLPCLPFISHRRRAVHGANGKFHLVENLGIRSECGVIVIILK